MGNEIEDLIAKKRGVLEDALAVAIEARDVANREVKRLRDELGAAPRLHVKRQRKPKVELVTAGEYIASLDTDVADLELTSAGEIKVRRAGA